jgi:hypothetical protein
MYTATPNAAMVVCLMEANCMMQQRMEQQCCGICSDNPFKPLNEHEPFPNVQHDKTTQLWDTQRMGLVRMEEWDEIMKQ